MRNFRYTAVAATMFVGLTTSAIAQSYKPPIVGVRPPAVNVPRPVVTVPTSSSAIYKPVFNRADAQQVMAAARAEAQQARAEAQAAAAAARAAARAGR